MFNYIEKMPNNSPNVVVLLIFSSAIDQSSNIITSSPIFAVVSLCGFRYSSGHEVIYHYGFNFH